MNVLLDILRETWEVFLVASPFILVGLAAAGLLHILIRPEQVARWLGGRNLGSIGAAAGVGIPLPLCSCSVVPVTIELSRKGASREASLAFMVSTPETGADSILLTYALMGPVMAVARPLAALCTSLVAALTSLVVPAEPMNGRLARPPETNCGCDPCSPAPPPPAEGVEAKTRRGIKYGFVTMVDEIGFWLVGGLLLTGIISALIPDGLLKGSLGEGPFALVALLLAGIPLYMCASASTPIAAALLLKGVSPGAALVFLLAGPATNASSLVLIARFFGRSFVRIYLISIFAVSLLSGFLLDLLLRRTGWQIIPRLDLANGEEITWLFYLSAAILGILLAWRAAAGSWSTSIHELVEDLRSWWQVLSRSSGRESSET